MRARHGPSPRPYKASQYIRNLLFAENLTCPVPYVYQAHYKWDSPEACLPVSGKVKSFRLRFFEFGLAQPPRMTSAMSLPPHFDHKQTAHWRPLGCLRTTWLRTVDEDVQSVNFGSVLWRKARVLPSSITQETGIFGTSCQLCSELAENVLQANVVTV